MLDHTDPRASGLAHLLMLLIKFKIKSADAREVLSIPSTYYGYGQIATHVNDVVKGYILRVEAAKIMKDVEDARRVQ